MWMAAVNLSDKQQALSVASLIHDKHRNIRWVIKIPNKLLSLKLIRASKLQSSTLMNVRANVDLQKPTVYKDTIKAI